MHADCAGWRAVRCRLQAHASGLRVALQDAEELSSGDQHEATEASGESSHELQSDKHGAVIRHDSDERSLCDSPCNDEASQQTTQEAGRGERMGVHLRSECGMCMQYAWARRATAGAHRRPAEQDQA